MQTKVLVQGCRPPGLDLEGSKPGSWNRGVGSRFLIWVEENCWEGQRGTAGAERAPEREPSSPRGRKKRTTNRALLKVSLCKTILEWQAEGSGTLGVQTGEWVAVSREAERGWVYGERVWRSRLPVDPERPLEGWLPKKVLEYVVA